LPPDSCATRRAKRSRSSLTVHHGAIASVRAEDLVRGQRLEVNEAPRTPRPTLPLSACSSGEASARLERQHERHGARSLPRPRRTQRASVAHRPIARRRSHGHGCSSATAWRKEPGHRITCAYVPRFERSTRAASSGTSPRESAAPDDPWRIRVREQAPRINHARSRAPGRVVVRSPGSAPSPPGAGRASRSAHASSRRVRPEPGSPAITRHTEPRAGRGRARE